MAAAMAPTIESALVSLQVSPDPLPAPPGFYQRTSPLSAAPPPPPRHNPSPNSTPGPFLTPHQSRLAACGRAARHGDLEGLSETRSEAAKLYAQAAARLTPHPTPPHPKPQVPSPTPNPNPSLRSNPNPNPNTPPHPATAACHRHRHRRVSVCNLSSAPIVCTHPPLLPIVCTQVERALGVFEGALSPAPSDAPFAPVAVPAVAPAAAAAGFAPRLASAPPLELRGSSPTGDARPGGAQLPDGWGERQSAVSADELMRRGIILPDEPLGDLK